MCFFYEEKYEEAYDAFYKATWTNEQQEMSFYYLAAITVRKKEFSLAFEFIEKALFLGENGAGKSTLLKILNGDYQPTNGKYLLNGIEKHFIQPYQAIEEGISVIYQERQILMELTVAENVYLGRLPAGNFGKVNLKEANKRTQEIINDFSLDIKATGKVKDLIDS